jgi:hypothetical protein
MQGIKINGSSGKGMIRMDEKKGCYENFYSKSKGRMEVGRLTNRTRSKEIEVKVLQSV